MKLEHLVLCSLLAGSLSSCVSSESDEERAKRISESLYSSCMVRAKRIVACERGSDSYSKEELDLGQRLTLSACKMVFKSENKLKEFASEKYKSSSFNKKELDKKVLEDISEIKSKSCKDLLNN